MYTNFRAASINPGFVLIMKILSLAVPATAYIPSYAEALREGHYCGADKLKNEEMVQKILKDPQGFLDDLLGPKPPTFINELGEEIERVPQQTMWLVEGKKFIGDAKIRHRLTPALEKSGGHIGYGVRPSCQGKGYATEMLRFSLVWMRDNLKAERALLSCLSENIASARVMEKNGGVLIDVTPHPYQPGKMQKRYWVPVPRT